MIKYGGACFRREACSHPVNSINTSAISRAVPTILMTAYPDERTQAQAIKPNVVCYLIKPFAADELLACVGRAVKRHDVGGG
jgi:DNA-binding NtrC family response regulator